MCMDIRNEFWEIFFYVLQMKRYLRLSKKICSFVNYVTLYVLFVLEEVQILQLKPTLEL